MKWYVYRMGSNAANQPMNNGPVHVATVEAADKDAARKLAAKCVTVYNNQYLYAEEAEEVDARESDIDAAVELPEYGPEDSLVAAAKQAHDTLVFAGFYIACSQPGMSADGLLSLNMAVHALRIALEDAEQAVAAERAARN